MINFLVQNVSRCFPIANHQYFSLFPSGFLVYTMSAGVTDASVSMHGRGMWSLSPALSRSSRFAVRDDPPPASLTLWDVLSPLQVLFEGLINSIPEPVWSRNPFENLPNIIDSLADRCTCADTNKRGSYFHWLHSPQRLPWVQKMPGPVRVSAYRRSPTGSVLLTFSFSLEMAEVFITFSYFPVVSS